MIAIVDYGMGNLGSIQNMLARIGAQSIITSDREVIGGAEKLILPGVGHFDRAMENLRTLDLLPLLAARVCGAGVKVLGICLGMQLLSKGSEEGVLPGLGWIDAHTVRFRQAAEGPALRIPHMGWSDVHFRYESPLAREMDPEPRFYFVHSFHVRCNDPDDVLATASYGCEFTAAVSRGNVAGTQFHPEKSHRFGMRFLRNFAEW